uniref:Uncharacterized protein n=1 Tax=Cacopsylla melanoneura TaxID=428564 RepID=A0A8D8WLW6_9HEMI
MNFITRIHLAQSEVSSVGILANEVKTITMGSIIYVPLPYTSLNTYHVGTYIQLVLNMWAKVSELIAFQTYKYYLTILLEVGTYYTYSDVVHSASIIIHC